MHIKLEDGEVFPTEKLGIYKARVQTSKPVVFLHVGIHLGNVILQDDFEMKVH
jgi:hypothetical protein